MSSARRLPVLLAPLVLALVLSGLVEAPVLAQPTTSTQALSAQRSHSTDARKAKVKIKALAPRVNRFAGTLVQVKERPAVRKRKIRIEGKPIGRPWQRLGAMKETKKGKAQTVIAYPSSGPWQVRMVLKGKGRAKARTTRPRGVYVVPDFKPTIIAHRGGAGEAPENTLGAYQQAIARGAKAVETDVQLTLSDNGDNRQLVLMHDDTFDRTTNARSVGLGGLPVKSATPTQVSQLRGLDGQPIPRFEDLLQIIKASPGVVLHAEVKTPSGDGEVEQRVINAVNAAGLGGRVVLSSFDPTSVTRLRQKGGGGLQLSFIVNTVGEFNASPVPANSVTLNSAAATTSAIANFHARGLPVYVFTVDDQEFWYRFADAYTDGIVTDLPTSARANVN